MPSGYLINTFDVTITFVDSPGVDSMYEHISSERLFVVARDLDHVRELIDEHRPHSSIDGFRRTRYTSILGIDEPLLELARQEGALLSEYCTSGDHERCYHRKAVWDAVDGLGAIDCECSCHEDPTP